MLFFIIYVSKLPALLLLILDDVIRFVKWAVVKMSQPKQNYVGQKISRSQFLAKASIVAAAIPASALGFGILGGAYDYRVRRKRIPIANLPKAFDGMKLGQISDIHS